VVADDLRALRNVFRRVPTRRNSAHDRTLGKNVARVRAVDDMQASAALTHDVGLSKANEAGSTRSSYHFTDAVSRFSSRMVTARCLRRSNSKIDAADDALFIKKLDAGITTM